MPFLESFSETTDRISQLIKAILEQKYFILKNLAILIVIYVIILLAIPVRFESTALIGIFPPQFSSEVQTKPLTVMTAKEILMSPELQQHIINYMKDGHAVIQELQKRKPLDVVCQYLKSSTTDEIKNEVEFANVDTIRYLQALSNEDIKALLLWKTDDLNELTVDSLAKVLDCEEIEEKKTAVDIIYSPLIRLFAISNNGEKAMVLANTWSYLFEQKYIELTNEKQDMIVNYLEDQQNKSQLELEEIETSIVLLKSVYNTKIYESQIKAYIDVSDRRTRKLLDKQNELMTDTNTLRRLSDLRNVLMKDGLFVGAINSIDWDEPETSNSLSVELRHLRPTEKDEVPPFEYLTTLPLELQPADLKFYTDKENVIIEEVNKTIYQNIKDQIIQSRTNRENNIKNIQEFERKYPIEEMEMRLNAVQKEVFDLRQEKSEDELRLAANKEIKQNILTELQKTSQTLLLQKSIPAETVSQAKLSKREKALENIGNLYDEVLNPTWSNLTRRLNTVNSEIDKYTKTIAEIERVLPEKEKTYHSLGIDISKARELKKVFGEALDKWNKSSDEQYSDFMNINKTITTTSLKMFYTKSEIEQLKLDRDRALQMAHDTQKNLDEAQKQFAMLEIKKSALQKKADLLLNKFHQAQMAARNNVNDISFAARAVAPTRHYFPPRTIMFIGLMFCSLLVLCMLALKRQIRSETEVAGHLANDTNSTQR